MGAGNTVSADPNRDPIQEAACTGMDDLLVSCRLFRTDGNRCRQVCLMSMGGAEDGGLGYAFSPDHAQQHSNACFEEQGELTNQIENLASGTAQATIARHMLSMRQCNDVSFDVDIEFLPLFASTPPPDAGWVRTLREHHHELRWRERDDATAWSDQDREELARIDHFQFRATKLVVTFSARDGDTEHAGGVSRDLSVNDKRLLFEGFDWK